MEEFNLSDHEELLQRYYFSGSPVNITREELEIIAQIEDNKDVLARGVAGALMHRADTTREWAILEESKRRRIGMEGYFG